MKDCVFYVYIKLFVVIGYVNVDLVIFFVCMFFI